MNRVEFTIDWFHKENDRQTSLNDSLNIPIGILTGILALLFYMFTGFSFESESVFIIEFSFVLFMTLAVLCWVLVVFFLFKSYNNLFHSFTYKGIPYPTELNEQYKNLEKYVEENKGLLDKNITADTLYENQLNEMLSEYLNQNIENNDKKSWHLHVAKKFLLGCIVFAILSSIPFIIHFSSNKEVEKIQKVEVKNIKDFSEKINNLEINNLKIGNYGRQRQNSAKTDSSTASSTASSETNKGR